jgi:hypothetical protein
MQSFPNKVTLVTGATSGIGRTHGALGFDEMTQTQAIVHDILPFARQSMWWYPHGKELYRGLLVLCN